MAFRVLSWMPTAWAELIYTTVFKPKPMRALVQFAVKKIIPAELTVKGVRLVLNPDDAVVSGSLTLGCFEVFELDLFESLLRPGHRVIDIGANIGLYASVSAKTVGPEGHVLAIEASPENCAFIERTRQLNGLPNVDVANVAVSDRTGDGELHLCSNNKADHRIYAGGGGARQTVSIHFTRLDDLLADRTDKRVNLIKMDVQGAEAMALDGMRQTLADNESVIVMMEFWAWGIERSGRSPADMLALVRSLGFTVYEIDGRQKRIVEVLDDAPLVAANLERQHTNLLLSRAKLDTASIAVAATRPA